ncbi:histone deacetylase [Colwellia psychrerythraea]|uniref:Histone deacetylase domain containing protein n=1 Tax=Colwellia psychrerythraea TaxID=28229 RepID=A0A099L3F1_COLPS|nr:histone deacetylase [Colwellia psychrerythraea]KGJ96637.1 Histone deacetylase domain containing protein [Colwellia psychrerythraea]
MIHIFYSENFNIDLGLLRYLHPFDGMKFQKVFDDIQSNSNIKFHSPENPISLTLVNEFVNELIELLIIEKVTILRALEVPNIPFVGFSYLDKKILSPMRYGVSATLQATKLALTGKNCWNLAGGYHHASQHNMEGFCIYNDIGITYQELIKSGELINTDQVLIIDTDAHHGNGNARTFLDNDKVKILDVYNSDIYPQSEFTRERIDFPVPVSSGISGDEYLAKYQKALNTLSSDYKVAFVVAGTDVLASDKLGHMKLTIDDVVEREKITLERLKALDIPVVFLGGGGYSKESAQAISAAINRISEL